MSTMIQPRNVPDDVHRRLLDDLAVPPLRRYPHGPLLARALEFRDNATIRDAVSLALVEAPDAVLLTWDARALRTCRAAVGASSSAAGTPDTPEPFPPSSIAEGNGF